eukprot:256876-Chlamydomonas_euryale.AAC.2
MPGHAWRAHAGLQRRCHVPPCLWPCVACAWCGALTRWNLAKLPPSPHPHSSPSTSPSFTSSALPWATVLLAASALPRPALPWTTVLLAASALPRPALPWATVLLATSALPRPALPWATVLLAASAVPRPALGAVPAASMRAARALSGVGMLVSTYSTRTPGSASTAVCGSEGSPTAPTAGCARSIAAGSGAATTNAPPRCAAVAAPAGGVHEPPSSHIALSVSGTASRCRVGPSRATAGSDCMRTTPVIPRGKPNSGAVAGGAPSATTCRMPGG